MLQLPAATAQASQQTGFIVARFERQGHVCSRSKAAVPHAGCQFHFSGVVWHGAEGFACINHDTMLCERCTDQHAHSTHSGLSGSRPKAVPSGPACLLQSSWASQPCMRLHPLSLHRSGAKALGIFTRGCSLFHSHAALLRCVGVHGLVYKGLLSSGCMQALHAPSSAAYLVDLTKGSWRKCHGKFTGAACLLNPLCCRCMQAHTARSTRLCATACKWWRSKSFTI